MLVFTQKRVNFYLEVNELLSWITAKEAILAIKDEYQDFDHVELLQKKFDDFQKVKIFLNFAIQVFYRNWIKFIFIFMFCNDSSK